MERIRRALLGGHPLIYVLTWEESRVERLGAMSVGHPAAFGERTA